MISDLTDSINYNKMQLKQKEEKVSQVLTGNELMLNFADQSRAIDNLIDKFDQDSDEVRAVR